MRIRTIEGEIIKNEYFKSVESWPYREATEIPVKSFSDFGLDVNVSFFF